MSAVPGPNGTVVNTKEKADTTNKPKRQSTIHSPTDIKDNNESAALKKAYVWVTLNLKIHGRPEYVRFALVEKTLIKDSKWYAKAERWNEAAGKPEPYIITWNAIENAPDVLLSESTKQSKFHLTVSSHAIEIYHHDKDSKNKLIKHIESNFKDDIYNRLEDGFHDALFHTLILKKDPLAYVDPKITGQVPTFAFDALLQNIQVILKLPSPIMAVIQNAWYDLALQYSESSILNTIKNGVENGRHKTLDELYQTIMSLIRHDRRVEPLSIMRITQALLMHEQKSKLYLIGIQIIRAVVNGQFMILGSFSDPYQFRRKRDEDEFIAYGQKILTEHYFNEHKKFKETSAEWEDCLKKALTFAVKCKNEDILLKSFNLLAGFTAGRMPIPEKSEVSSIIKTAGTIRISVLAQREKDRKVNELEAKKNLDKEKKRYDDELAVAKQEMQRRTDKVVQTMHQLNEVCVQQQDELKALREELEKIKQENASFKHLSPEEVVRALGTEASAPTATDGMVVQPPSAGASAAAAGQLQPVAFQYQQQAMITQKHEKAQDSLPSGAELLHLLLQSKLT